MLHSSAPPDVTALPERPDFASWRSVLRGPVDVPVLAWLVSWVHAVLGLSGDVDWRGLWAELTTASLPWTDELLAAAFGPGSNGGPPTVLDAMLLLEQPSSGLLLRRRMGFSARLGGSPYTDLGRVSFSALRDDGAPLSLVALHLSQGLDAGTLLLSDEAALYDTALDLIAVPGMGGGPDRIETFLSLWEDGWHSSMGALVCTTVELVPGPSHPPGRGLDLLYGDRVHLSSCRAPSEGARRL